MTKFGKKKCQYCGTKKDVRGIKGHERYCKQQAYLSPIPPEVDGVIWEMDVNGDPWWPDDDPISPAHYHAGGFEAIRVMMAYHPTDPLMATALKYVLRAGKKEALVEDARKAIRYLEWVIDREEGRELR